MSGLYLSDLLSRQRKTFEISVLNRESSVGGRLLSCRSINGQILEMGAMRIPCHHQLTLGLCSELGLHLKEFNGSCLNSQNYELEADLDEDGNIQFLPSSWILDRGIKEFCQVDNCYDVQSEWLMFKLALRLSDLGLELGDLSFAEFVRLVLKPNEEKLFWNGIGYDYLRLQDVSATHSLRNGFTVSKDSKSHFTVSTGMQSIATEIHKRISMSGVRVFTNETAISVHRRSNGYRVKTRKGHEFECDLLVLAIPPKEAVRLNQASSFLDKEYLAALHDIGDYSSTKTYAMFPRNTSLIERLDSGFFRTGLSIRQGHFNPCGSTSSHDYQTVLAEYKNLLGDKTDLKTGPSSITNIVNCLNQMLKTTLDEPAFWSTINWSTTQSCVAAHYWKIGANPNKTICKLQSLDDNIAFTGEAVSMGQGWVEGALSSARTLVNVILSRYEKGLTAGEGLKS